MKKINNFILTHLRTFARGLIIVLMLLASWMTFGTPDGILKTVPPEGMEVSIEMKTQIEEGTMVPLANTFKELKELDNLEGLARNRVNDKKLSYVRIYILGRIVGAVILISALYASLYVWLRKDFDILYLMASLCNVGIGTFMFTGGTAFGGTITLYIIGGTITAITLVNYFMATRLEDSSPIETTQPLLEEL